MSFHIHICELSHFTSLEAPISWGGENPVCHCLSNFLIILLIQYLIICIHRNFSDSGLSLTRVVENTPNIDARFFVSCKIDARFFVSCAMHCLVCFCSRMKKCNWKCCLLLVPLLQYLHYYTLIYNLCHSCLLPPPTPFQFMAFSPPISNPGWAVCLFHSI